MVCTLGNVVLPIVNSRGRGSLFFSQRTYLAVTSRMCVTHRGTSDYLLCQASSLKILLRIAVVCHTISDIGDRIYACIKAVQVVLE